MIKSTKVPTFEKRVSYDHTMMGNPFTDDGPRSSQTNILSPECELQLKIFTTDMTL